MSWWLLSSPFLVARSPRHLQAWVNDTYHNWGNIAGRSEIARTFLLVMLFASITTILHCLCTVLINYGSIYVIVKTVNVASDCLCTHKKYVSVGFISLSWHLLIIFDCILMSYMITTNLWDINVTLACEFLCIQYYYDLYNSIFLNSLPISYISFNTSCILRKICTY